MGGSSVPSSTTQTTMLDPTRQAALKKSMGYFDKWANSYNGPSYKGPLVASLTPDWYKAQDMAHRLSNRFASGGITNVRRFDDGGSTFSLTTGTPDTSAPTTSAPAVELPVITSYINADPNQASLNNAPAADTNTTPVDNGNYTPNVSSGNAGNPNLFAQAVTNAGLGNLFGLTGVQPNQISNSYTAGKITPDTVSSGYTAGTISAGTPITSGYTAGTISAGTPITSSYTAGTVTPGTVTYSYTPDQMDKINAMTSDYTAGTHSTKDVTANSWDQAAMDQYMSPYTKGVVDIALREAERQRAIERLKENTAATQSGAFGGYRQGVVEAEGERNYNQLLSDITTKGQQEAYNAAVAQFNADRAVDVAVQQFNENNSLENFKTLEQAKQTAAQLKLSAEQNNAANTINAYQAVQQAKQAAASGNLSASSANAANALQAGIANEQAKQAAAQMGLTASTSNAANALNAAIAQEQAKQAAGQQSLTASTSNAANTLNAAIANEQAKQQAGQMGITAATTNATNKVNAAIASEQAAQQAAQMTTTAAQNNITNGLAALTSSIQAYQAGMTGAQGLAAIDTAYNNNVQLAYNLMQNNDATVRAAGQALLTATIDKANAADAIDLTKAQAGSELAGLKTSNTGSVSVTNKQ